MRKPIVLTAFRFDSQKDCKAAVRAIVDPHRQSGAIFASELLSELFAERHYALAARDDLWPRLFKWGTHPDFNTKDCFYCELANYGWRPISYNKAITAWRLTDATLDAELAEYYRRAALSYVLPFRDAHPWCQHDGCNAMPVDVHHVAPTFDEMAVAASALLTGDERAVLVRRHSWFDKEQWQVPAKCLHAIAAAHRDAKLMSLCKQHHYDRH